MCSELCSSVAPAEAAEREVAARIAPMTNVGAMRAIDLVVVGSVAVNEKGARLGKGAGYSDIELGLLVEAGLVTARTTVCTTVHELQVLDEELPRAPPRLPGGRHSNARTDHPVQ